MTEQLYIRIRGRVQGPFEVEKLRQLARRGQFSRMHEISPDGHLWSMAKERADLFASPSSSSVQSVAVASSSGPATSVADSTASYGLAAPAAESRQSPWYYAFGGKEQGPIEYAALRDLFATRRLTPDTQVWSEGMSQWTAAEDVAGLLPAASPSFPALTVASVDTKRSATDEVATGVMQALTDGRPWVVFIAVIGFVYAALLLIAGIVQVVFGGRSGLFPLTAMGLFNVIFAVVIGTGSWLLVNHASWISRLERTQRDDTLRSCLATLKTFWVFVGIVLIVFLALGIIAAVLFVSLAGALPDFKS